MIIVAPDHSQWHARARAHTHTHTHTNGRTPLDEESTLHRDLYSKKHNVNERQMSMPAA